MPTWNTAFNGSPVGSDNVSSIDTSIQDLKQAVFERVTKEHVMDLSAGGATADGWHRSGSARAYYTTPAPTKRPDGATSLDTGDTGRLYIDSTTKKLRVWDGSAFQLATVEQADYAYSLNPNVENFTANATLASTTRVAQYNPPSGNTITLKIPAGLAVGSEITFLKTTTDPCTCIVEGVSDFIGGGTNVTICSGSTRRYDVCMFRKTSSNNWERCEGLSHSEATGECSTIIGNSFKITVSTSAPSGGANGDVWIQI